MAKHLAQLNIAKTKAPLDDPAMKEFVDFLDPVNALADTSPGFVWRLQGDSGVSSSYIPPAFDDATIITNMSVWEDLESLRESAYRTVHSYFVKSHKRWFNPMDRPKVVLWWVEEGHIPTVEEARARLEQLEVEGPTATAFTFAVAFDPDGVRLEKPQRVAAP